MEWMMDAIREAEQTSMLKCLAFTVLPVYSSSTDLYNPNSSGFDSVILLLFSLAIDISYKNIIVVQHKFKNFFQPNRADATPAHHEVSFECNIEQ